ncbi:MAG: hypothetical protein AB1630_00145 [bacterium]
MRILKDKEIEELLKEPKILPVTTYQDFHSGLNCFLKDNNFKKPENKQIELFNGGDFL